MLKKLRLQTLTIPWNLFLISAGSFIFAIGVKAVAMPQEFISGGMSGLCLLIFYWTQWLSPGIWYFIIIERTFNVLGRGFSHRKIY